MNAEPADARDGSDVDDGAPVLPLHMPEPLLAGLKQALQVDVVDPVPALSVISTGQPTSTIPTLLCTRR
jgi:hypothetical protein